MPKATQSEIKLYQRLLQQEETASSELCELYLDHLVNHFKAIYAKDTRCDDDLVNDAVTDALLNFIDAPSKFDPNQGTLENYLKMSAEGDIRNALAKIQRKSKSIKKNLGEPVELDADSRNSIIDDRSENPEQSLINKEIETQLKNIFPNEIDFEIASLILANVKEARVFAELLGIAELPEDEQRKHIKRTKDRIKVKLKRANVEKLLR